MINNNFAGPECIPSTPEKLLIMLHGYGSDGEDLFALSSFWQQAFPKLAIISPNAPSPCEINPYGYQWFSLPDLSLSTITTGLKSTEPSLQKYISDQLARFNLTENDLYLLGFSQGSILSLYTGLKRLIKPKAILSFSGGLPLEIAKESLQNSLLEGLNIALIHGASDEVVPVDTSLQISRFLKNGTNHIKEHIEPMLGHGISSAGLQFAIDFCRNLE